MMGGSGNNWHGKTYKSFACSPNQHINAAVFFMGQMPFCYRTLAVTHPTMSKHCSKHCKFLFTIYWRNITLHMMKLHLYLYFICGTAQICFMARRSLTRQWWHAISYLRLLRSNSLAVSSQWTAGM